MRGHSQPSPQHPTLGVPFGFSALALPQPARTLTAGHGTEPWQQRAGKADFTAGPFPTMWHIWQLHQAPIFSPGKVIPIHEKRISGADKQAATLLNLGSRSRDCEGCFSQRTRQGNPSTKNYKVSLARGLKKSCFFFHCSGPFSSWGQENNAFQAALCLGWGWLPSNVIVNKLSGLPGF